MNPLHAKYYADQAVQRAVEIVENARLAKDTYRVRFRAPEIARRIVPGQFLMLRLAEVNDPLIGRPLALYDTVADSDGRPEMVDVVYLVKGKLTSRLWQMQPGQRLDVWGPLGNGFFTQQVASGQEPGARSQTTHAYAPIPTEHLIMVAGGIGQTPFLALAQEALHKKCYGDPPRDVPRVLHVTFCYGARTADYLAGIGKSGGLVRLVLHLEHEADFSDMIPADALAAIAAFGADLRSSAVHPTFGDVRSAALQ